MSVSAANTIYRIANKIHVTGRVIDPRLPRTKSKSVRSVE